MTEPVRIAILGGSSAFTPALADALAARADELPALEVLLFGRNAASLRAVATFCDRRAAHHGAPHRYLGSTDLPESVEGARVVVNQIRVGGWGGRAHDERFPLRFGLPGDETIGPGGLASAVRSVPAILEIARTCAAVAPRAWFVNLSNPLGILLRALAAVPDLRAFGLCELPEDTLRRALRLIGERPDDVESVYWGLNHQGGFTRVQRAGRDLLPRIHDAIEELPDDGFFRVEAEVMRAEGMLPLPYMRLYFHTEREVRLARERSRSRGDELEELSRELLGYYAKPDSLELPPALARRSMPWIADTVVPAVVALLGGRASRPYVSEANAGHLPDLADDVVVEKAALVTAEGPRPVDAGGDRMREAPPSPDFLAFLAKLADYEARAVEAALRPTRDAIRDALASHPLEIDASTADAMVPDVMNPDPVSRAIDELTDGRREQDLMRAVRSGEVDPDDLDQLVPPFPLKVQIQTTSLCNARCRMCPWPDTSTRLPQGRMTTETFHRIVEQMRGRGVERTGLFLMNEPLLDERLEEFTTHLKANVPDTVAQVYTNGVLLDESRARSLAEAGLDEVAVSLVGFDRRAHERTMIGVDFDTVMDNLDAVGRLSRAGVLGEMRVMVVCLQWHDPPAGTTELQERTGLPVFLRPVTNRAGSIDVEALGASGPAPRPFRACQRPFVKAYFLHDGDMVLCNSDWERTTIIGNVHERSVESLWRDERLMRIRRAHARGSPEPDTPCARCDYPGTT